VHRDQLLTFSREAAHDRLSLFGIAVIFRGVTVQCLDAGSTGSLDLQIGGFATEATWTLRMPASVMPPPEAKEKIHRVSDGKLFVVTRCDPAPADSANRHFHTVETQEP
jgi:hypothetical protein